MVSRGTRETLGRQVRQLAVADFEYVAMALQQLTMLRLPVMPANSAVRPGTFEGLDLETGRARWIYDTAEIRARCTFESGQVRAVQVSPIFAPGDLFWITPTTRKRADSEYTIEVVNVDAKRLQDCGDLDAHLMGAGCVKRSGEVSDRSAFAQVWDTKWPRTLPNEYRWHKNPWCWELRVLTHADQVGSVAAHLAKGIR